MFELDKYEKQVETNISICFILMLMSDLGTAVAWIGLTACATLFGQLVYYPFWCKKKDEYLFVPWWIPSPIFCMATHPAMLRGTAREEGNSSGLLHSRYFNRQKRNKKERVHRNDVPSLYRAEDEAQTRDPQLGRLMLYQLSYFRNFFCGQRWIRTTEGVSQQIYSLPHLATLVFALKASAKIALLF